MIQNLPIDITNSSLVIRELITRLRVCDVMSTDMITARRSDTLRTVQLQMKERGITGVPIAENGRVFGIVSVDDIIQALDEGHINDRVDAHMTKNVVLLEEYLPLSLAVSQFQRYSYGRFPVVNKEGLLVGIISSRDILTKLLVEINREVDRLETLIPASVPTSDRPNGFREFTIKQYDLDNGGKATESIKKLCESIGLDSRTCRRIAVIVYELEINLAIHSYGGVISCSYTPECFRIVSRDNGPGIADRDLAVTPGFTTANDWVKSLGFGAGMGLPNIKRVADEFHITSAKGHGTVVTVSVNLVQTGGGETK